jgi:hypothetical protein
MPMSSTSGDPAALGRCPGRAREAAAELSPGQAGGQPSHPSTPPDACPGFPLAAQRCVEFCNRLIACRNLAVKADAAIAGQLETCQSDDLRKELNGYRNELNELLKELLAVASTVAAILEMPIHYLCEKFAKLAHIQDSKRHLFDKHIAEALHRWVGAFFLHTESGSAVRTLGALKRSMINFSELLAKVNGTDDLLHDNVRWRLSFELEDIDPTISELLDGAKKFGAVIDRALGRGHDRRGRTVGVRQYPEIDTLVFYLELSAQRAGGKFTAHKIQNGGGGKGTMIEALNLLRTVVSAELAEALPAAGQHPISTYKRVINHARKVAAARTGIIDISTALVSGSVPV